MVNRRNASIRNYLYHDEKWNFLCFSIDVCWRNIIENEEKTNTFCAVNNSVVGGNNICWSTH